MTPLLGRLILCLGLLCCSALAAAAPIVLTPASSGSSLNGQIELLEDIGAQLRIEDMARADIQQRFQPAAGRASVGLSPNPWWIKVSLTASRDAPQQWWLENGGITLLDLRLYLPDGQGGWQQRLSGEQVPFAAGRDLPYRRQVFQLPLLGEQPLVVYLRSYDPRGNSFPLKIWQRDDLQQLAATENLGLSLLYGIILALMLYNLFILISLRDSAYFWYVLATGCALGFILSMSGHGFQYLWPGQAVPFWLDRVTLPALWAILVMRFTQALFTTAHDLRWAHHLLNLGCVVYAAAILVNALGLAHAGAQIIALAPILSMPVALIVATLRMRQGFFPARLYLIGYGSVLVSTVILVLRAGGILQPSPYTAYLFPLTVAAETILFSFALAYRIQILKHEKNAAFKLADQEKAARLLQAEASANQLQDAVNQRTAELAAANQQLRERELELQHAAFHDPLTELANRRYLMERAEAAMADALRRGESVALMLLDLDHFKPINDQYGHSAGDQVLQTIAQRLHEHVRGNDLVARLGGDEFAVLICGADAEIQACEIAQRLLDALAKPIFYGATPLSVTISIGAALYPQHAQYLAGLYKAADEALYEVKKHGRSGFSLHGANGAPSRADCARLDILQVSSGLAKSSPK